MPKIIKNLESRLIEEAKQQIRQSGYSAMTIRSVAKACGVGAGRHLVIIVYGVDYQGI